jgi:hypothetical protein
MYNLPRLATGILVVAAATGSALAAKPVDHFTAFAVDMSVRPDARRPANAPRSGTIDIIVERWSSPEERDRLVAALREGSTDGLLRELERIKHPAGHIRSATSIGYPLRFAWQVPNPEGGRRVIVATDRPVSFLEARDNPRSMDYPFLLIDFRINEKGEGQGKLMPLAKVQINDEHVVEIENYNSEPVRLTEVRERH